MSYSARMATRMVAELEFCLIPDWQQYIKYMDVDIMIRTRVANIATFL